MLVRVSNLIPLDVTVFVTFWSSGFGERCPHGDALRAAIESVPITTNSRKKENLQKPKDAAQGTAKENVTWEVRKIQATLTDQISQTPYVLISTLSVQSSYCVVVLVVLFTVFRDYFAKITIWQQ